MQGLTYPVVKDVVLVGAGHSHVTVLRMFGMKPVAGVRFTLISREVHTPYSGMLPGLIAGHYKLDDAHIDTAPLTRLAGARLYQDEVVGLDLAGRQVICRHRPPVPYDLLSFNIGSTPNTADVSGASEHAIPVKPIDGFISRFDALVARVLARKGCARVALVGAGAGGVELLLSVERRLRHDVVRAGFDAGGLSFVLVSNASDILPDFPAAFRSRFRADLGCPRDSGRCRRLRHRGCGWTAPTRWPGAGRGRRDPVDHAGCTSALVGTGRIAARRQRAFSRSMKHCVSSDMTTCSRPATPLRSRTASCPNRECTPCAPVQCWRTISAAP